MLDSTLREKYKKLQERERRYRRYRRVASWFLNSFLWSIAVALVIALFVIIVFKVSFSVILLWLPIYAWWGIAFLLMRVFDKKAAMYSLDSDEWALFYTCSALENLSNYVESKTSGLKEEYRKNALRSSKRLLSSIEKRWTTGDFKLAKTIFGDTISELKDNFRKRVIPNLEKGDSQTIRRVGQVMYNFAQYVRCPTSEGLGDFNKTTSNNLPLHEPTKFGFYEHFSIFIGKRAILKHILATIGFVIASSFVYLIGTNISISKEGCFIAAIALFGALQAGYWQHGKKEG